MIRANSPRLFIAVTVLLLFLCSDGVRADTSRHVFAFDKGKIVVNEVSGFDVLRYGNLEPTGAVGFPQVPVQLVHIPLAIGREIASIEVVDLQSEELTASYYLLPAQPPQVLSEPAHQFVSADPKIYSSSGSYPSEVATIAPHGFYSGYNVGSLLIHPLQYVPSRRKLIFHNRIEIEVTYKDSSKLPVPFRSTKYSRRVRENAARAHFDTPLPKADLLPQQAPGVSTLPDEVHAYIIITADNLVSQFQTLADWKKKRGLSAEIVTTSWIYANYAGSDQQEQIRNFIKDAYQNWGTMWVLLGGDVNIIPERRAWAMDCEVGQFNYNFIPCDLYYSDLDGDWNANGNDTYGEVDDDVDMYPDVFVGRAAVEDEGEANTFVLKVLDYESHWPANTDDILFLAEVLWTDPYTNSGLSKDLVDSLYVPARFDTITKLYEALGNETYENVMAALNAGPHIVNHCGHAYTEVMGIGDGYLLESDADALTNQTRQSIVYTIGCWPAAFDDDCIAEHFINNANGGAVAFIGNSRYGWGSPGNPLYGYSDRFDQRFFANLFPNDIHHIGQTLSAAKAAYVPFSQQENVYRWCEYEINLLGDPEMMIWTDFHGYFDVDHPAQVPVGDNRFTITVANGGSPVEGALVCLMQDSSVYESDFTGRDGRVTFVFGTTNPSQPIQLTVSAHNIMPYQGTIDVAGGDPYVCISSYGAGEADEKRIAPGDTVCMGMYVKNYGDQPAEGVEASLTCDNGHITIEDGFQNIGDIMAGDSIRILCIFSFQTASDLANGEVVYFNCEISDGNGNSWTNKISLIGATPVIAYSDHQLSDEGNDGDGDGIAEPGELIRVDMLVENTGLAGADYVEATVECGDPYIQVVDEYVVYWSIPPSGHGQVPTRIRIDPACPTPLFPRLHVSYHTRSGFEFADSFTIAVGEMGLFDDMENGEGGWTHSGTYDFWHLSDYRKHSGGYSWSSSSDILHTYVHGMLTILQSAPFVLEGNSELSFWCWYQFPNYGTDGFYVEIDGGSGWETLDFIGSGGALGTLATGNDWLEYNYDLSHYPQGTSMTLRFRFVTDLEDIDEGVYIDDVALRRPVSGDIVTTVRPQEQADQRNRLLQNYPNPFNPSTTIRYVLGESGPVKISVFDVQGALVRILKDGTVDAGEGAVVWDGKNEAGLPVSSGVYFYRFVSSAFSQTKKMVLLK